MYLNVRNFRGKKFSRTEIFADINFRGWDKFAKINVREIFEHRQFAKINVRENFFTGNIKIPIFILNGRFMLVSSLFLPIFPY